MAQADTNRVQLRYSKETVWGEAPTTPAMQDIRVTSESLIHNKNTVLSEVIRSDRLRDSLVEVAVNAEGDIGIELSFGTTTTGNTELDDMWEGLFQSTFTVVSSTGLDVTVLATARTFTDAGADFPMDGVVVGMWVKFTGFTDPGNNGIFQVEAVATTVITVTTASADDNGGLADETSGAMAVGLEAKMIRVGTTPTSLLIEKEYSDVTEFVYFTGMRVGSLSLAVEAESIATGTLTFQGKEGFSTGATLDATPVASSSDISLNATSDVGALQEGGANLTTALRTINLEINNNLRPKPQIGDRSPIDIGLGFVDVTGTAEAYFEDNVLYSKFLAHTASSLAFKLTDPITGSAMVWTVPRIFFSAGNPTTSGGNDDVILPLEFSGIRDSTTSTSIQLDLLE